ncbi:hypothetical protein L9G16_11395 [Shewanella sp. A25]|nr:hypothetical protein [Shewanella shenzhenensis]
MFHISFPPVKATAIFNSSHADIPMQFQRSNSIDYLRQTMMHRPHFPYDSTHKHA